MAHRQSIRVSTGESGLRILPRQFKDRVSQLTEETIDSLQRIWGEAGYEDVECQRLLGDLLNKLKITCANELAAEQQILEHAKQEVAANVAELSRMNDQLGRKTSVEHISKMNYTEKLAELEKLLHNVGEAYSQRQNMLEQEMTSIKKLCEELGESVPQENIFAGPAGTPYLSDLRLNLMREFVRDLEVMKQKRIEEMKSLAKEIVLHMSDMMYVEEGYKSMGDSEKYVSLDKNTVLLNSTGELSATSLTPHKQNLVAMTLRLKLFLEEKERRRQHLAASGDEIAKLWSLLRIPSVEREAFQTSFQRNLSMDTLAKGDVEVRRLQDIRRRSLGRVIQCIRSDIQTLWEEAGMETEEQRSREFPMFFRDIDALEDAAVDVHEAYFVQLRGRVEELKPILTKISKREQVVAERIELEHLQLNPERLTARGPNAREERKREEAMTNRVKSLEKVTKEVCTLYAPLAGLRLHTHTPFQCALLMFLHACFSCLCAILSS
ncbi:hypothetical protein EON65_29095 [archaeon]|nr:MAG: hypothetical protein EON65_29095 [archaeon]